MDNQTQTKLVNRFVIGTFVLLYLCVSIISTIHVVEFFKMSNPYWLAVSLAVAFELGAAASLASLIALDKMNKTIVWALFAIITLMQIQGNMFYAYSHVKDYQSWIELFNLVDEDPLYQKRILSFVSGAILPLVALGFIKSLVDYIKPTKEVATFEEPVSEKKTSVEVAEPVSDVDDKIVAEPEIEIKKDESNIIKDAKDYNNFLNKTVDGGLVNPKPQRRSVTEDHKDIDEMPTGFDHSTIKH